MAARRSSARRRESILFLARLANGGEVNAQMVLRVLPRSATSVVLSR